MDTAKGRIFEAILRITPTLVVCSPLQVILESKTGQAELELFPRYLLFLRQQQATRSPQSNIWVNMGMTTLRMFPPYYPPPRGNVSLQQDRSKPSMKCFTELPCTPTQTLLMLWAWADPAVDLLWTGKCNHSDLLVLHRLCHSSKRFDNTCSGALHSY